MTGGGYLRYKEDKTREYGGVLDLQFTKIGITAIGLIGTDPFSLVVVMGVHFLPKIELSLRLHAERRRRHLLAIERRLDCGCVARGHSRRRRRDAALPRRSGRLGAEDSRPPCAGVPAAAGRICVGPMAELGWGSQAGFVKAKMGVVLACRIQES